LVQTYRLRRYSQSDSYRIPLPNWSGLKRTNWGGEGKGKNWIRKTFGRNETNFDGLFEERQFLRLTIKKKAIPFADGLAYKVSI
jgi:hypothetical protein